MSLIKALENRGLVVARVASEDVSLISTIDDAIALFKKVKIHGNHFTCERADHEIPGYEGMGIVEFHGEYKNMLFMIKLEGPVRNRSWVVLVELIYENGDGDEDGYGEKHTFSSNPLKATDLVKRVEQMIKSRYDYIDDEDQE